MESFVLVIFRLSAGLDTRLALPLFKLVEALISSLSWLLLEQIPQLPFPGFICFTLVIGDRAFPQKFIGLG